ncbi:MAG: two-component regulator propeller domain-containing protein [Flavobacteriales bacterium]
MVILVLAFSILHFPFTIRAQQYTFIQYSINEGLAQSQVRCLAQDSRGFIWAGTLGGLSRFDGNTFFNYDKQKGLLHNQVNCLVQLSNGAMAAGCNGSIAIVTGAGVNTIALPADFADAAINTLHEKKGTEELWIGTEDGLLIYNMLQKNYRQHDEMTKPFAQSHIKRIDAAADEMLVLTREAFYSLHNKNLTHTLYKPTSDEAHLFDFVRSADGHYWLATRGDALVELDEHGQYMRNYKDAPGLITDILTGIIIGADGTFYVTSRFGFFKFDGERFISFAEAQGLPTADVRDMMQDNEGNLWLATYGNGIQKFTGEKFTSLTTKDGLIGDAIMSITEDKKGNLWFSTFDRGLCMYNGDTIIPYDMKALSGVNRIWSSLCDHEGRLWFGSSDGLFMFSDNRFIEFNTSDSLPANMILSLYEDFDNNIWIGTSKGLAQIADEKILTILHANAPVKRVRCIRQDMSGNMWFATNEGVYKYDGTQFMQFSQKDGLPDNSVNCIEVDEYNHIWAGTMSGLAMLDGATFKATHIGTSSNADVVNLLKFDGNTLWIGTNYGLHSATIQAESSPANLIFTHYGLEDGLRSLETNLNAVYSDDNGRIWFGTTQGITIANKSLISAGKITVPPLLTIGNIQINLQNQNWQTRQMNPDELSGLPISPAFNYKDNHLTFYFTGISTTYPRDVSYKYMLEGFDEEWKPITKNNFATYSNLPYNHYTFKVMAINKQGIWSNETLYSFSITAPFWLRWWFIALEALAVLGIVGYIIYNRRKATRAKREKEWFEIKSKMLALEQQSLNSSMNRHFIFNALNSIQYYINRQDRMAANRYLSDFAKLIRKNLDNSQDNLTTLRDEIERLELYLKLEHMRFKDKFEYSINVDPALNLDQTKVPAMLVQPFLENSIWHGLLPKTTQGKLEVDISKVNNHVEFTIRDNGVGIENSLKNKTDTDNHISKGMEITQSRIDLIRKTTGQSIELEGPVQLQVGMGEDAGTLVRIKLPENFHELFPG